MRAVMKESEQQRRRRVVSRIRNELIVHAARNLAELARVGKLPDRWLTVPEVNELLDASGYWATHPHTLAAFFSPAACEEVVAKALGALVNTYPDAWVQAGPQYRPATRDWNAYASAKANVIRRDFPGEERTAFHSGSDGTSILFAHENFANDPRARREVGLVRTYLRERGIPELGFGVSADGNTWVMVVWSEDQEALGKALFDAWQTAFEGDEPQP